MTKLLFTLSASCVGFALVGCSSNENSRSEGSGGDSGAGGAAAGNGGVTAGGAGGAVTGGGGGASGGADGGTTTGGSAGTGGGGGDGGNGGSGGDGDGGNGEAGLGDVDLTLGGSNQDLSPPTYDCTGAEIPSTGCIAFSGEYNGTPFDIHCQYAALGYVYLDSSRRIGCEKEMAPDDLIRIDFAFTDQLVEPVPGAFEFWLPPDTDELGFISVSRDARLLSSYDAGEDRLVDTHNQTFRVAARTDYVPGVFEGQTSERARGTFAVTLEPKATCVPDAEGFGCDHVRLRGNFHVRSIRNVTE